MRLSSWLTRVSWRLRLHRQRRTRASGCFGSLATSRVAEVLESRRMLSGAPLQHAISTLSPGQPITTVLPEALLETAATASLTSTAPVSHAGAGLVIIPTFDSSITSDANAATIEATINAVISLYEATFSDPLTVNITFAEMSTGLGQSEWFYNSVPYPTLRTALINSASTGNDAIAYSLLPDQATEPVKGGATVGVKSANERLLGLGGAAASDGTISLNTSICNLDRTNPDPNKYDLQRTVAHELDEMLGLGSGLDQGGGIFLMDLFRYAADGTRSYDPNTSIHSYFSIDGTTDLVEFNQSGSGDAGDWASTAIPRVQDAFAFNGVIADPNVEFVALDVQGYHSVVAPTDLTLSNAKVQEHLPTGTAVGAFSTIGGDSAGNQYTYSLISGSGSTDNASFTLSSDGHLTTNAVFDYNTKNSYSIRVRTMDQYSDVVDKVFTISIQRLDPVTLTVDVLDDTHVAGHTTLREAVALANADFVGDTIQFAPGLTGTIILTGGELDLQAPMIINGPGATLLSVSGNNTSRIFNIDDGSSTRQQVRISGLTLTGGRSARGGAILNNEALTLSNDIFTSNTATSSGGAIGNDGSVSSSNNQYNGNSSAGDGGAVESTGSYQSTNDRFTGNSADGNGGAIANSGTWTMSADSLSDNLATGDGGALANSGQVTTRGDTFSGNQAGGAGGAVSNSGTLIATNDTIFGNSAVNGGGISNAATLTTIHTTIAGNTAAATGGGVDQRQGTWNALNSIIAGNTALAGANTIPSDVSLEQGTISASHTLVGDANSSGGIVDGASGNLVGRATAQIFATDNLGNPVLADNGGVNLTVALVKGSVANGAGTALATLISAVTASATSITVNTSAFLVLGDFLKIDAEVVVVTAINGSTITVQRAQNGTTAASHAQNATLQLAFDQTGATRENADLGSLVGTENHAPQGAPHQLTILEDGSYAFQLNDFSFADVADSPANNFAAVKITTLPTHGVLKDNGVAVTAGQIISTSDISSGKFQFVPAANANGTSYGNFTFQVQDDGGTQGGGKNTDPTPRLMSINVTSVNDAPAGTSATVSTLEDHGYIFQTADFGFTDPNDQPANALYAVKIASLPAKGTLKNHNSALTAGQFVSVADILGGNLVFVPASNEFGANYANFKFQVQDDNGTANGGADLDPTARTMTLNVTNIDDAPVGTAKTITLLEDASYVLKAADFGFTDPQDNPPNQLLAVKLTTLPTKGRLTLGGGAAVAGQSVSVADLNAGKLVFRPALNGNSGTAASYTGFTFQVQDNGGTANGGIDTDPSPKTITLGVTSVNDAPAGQAATVNAVEDLPYAFKSADFGFTDPNDTPANQLGWVIVTSLPAKGTLSFNGAPVTAGQQISATDLNAHKLVYTPLTNQSGTNYAQFQFRVRDNGGTANGGVDTDLTARQLTLNVTSVNDAPTGTSATLAAVENTVYVFKVSDFGFRDPNDNPANTLQAVKFSLLPTLGTLKLGNTPLTIGQTVNVQDISQGKLTFTPRTNLLGGPYFLGKFQVQDNGGTASGGHNIDPTPEVLNVQLARLNHAPTGAQATVNAVINTAYVLKTSDFGFRDPGDTPANQFQAVKFTLLPTLGSLTLNGAPVSVNQFVSTADISAGKLKFTPNSSLSGGPYFLCKFQVQDNGGTAGNGVDLDPTPEVLYVKLSGVNHSPQGTSGTVTSPRTASYVMSIADFGFTDPNDQPANSLLAVRFSVLPTLGTLTDNGIAMAVNQSVSAADIANGKLVFTPRANLAAGTYFLAKFQVQDNGGTTGGGHDLDPIARVLYIALKN